ncbi:MAG: hypothetical protein F6J87_25605 [Spirulina sp. SIO3F2]|nr:hypothetical protein [Spirulina sp. SIO3F2]
MTVDLISVTTPEHLEQFLQLPRRIYAQIPQWVEPLRSSIAHQLAPDNPFQEYGELQAFLAVQDDRPVGRIVAAVNRRLIEREGQQVGLFGYFETIDSLEVAQVLLKGAEDWLRDRGMTSIRGPINLSTHNSCLFLVDSFDRQPQMMMPYNPNYYPRLLEQLHWPKAKDAYAYDLPLDLLLDPKFEKGYKIAIKSGITFRSIHTKGDGFDEDCKALYELFTTAFANNWSSSARSEAEFLAEAKDLKQLVDPDIFPIAEDQGKMIGFFMALPDYNQALKYVNGKLNWCGILKFLWYRRSINRARVIGICSLPEYRRKMVPLALIYLGMKNGTQKGKPYREAELSYVWEDNSPSRKIIEASGAKIAKTYRVYERAIE